jgi:hypothetical protein
MSARVTWMSGGEASVVSLGAKAIVLRSTVPSPPGSRLEGTLVGEPPARLKVKVHGCKRQPEGDFELEGRPIDLTRQVRERIEAGAAAKALEGAPGRP